MSLIDDLSSTLDKRSLNGIAAALGESDQSVSRGMQAAIGTVLGGLACKSESPSFLRRALDMLPSGTGAATWSNLASAVADPNSPLISAGKRMLSTLFGGSEGMITNALGAGTGLRPGVTSSLMTMAAPMVMAFLGKRVSEEGMSMDGLGSFLKRETPAIRAALPAGVTELLWPRPQEAITGSPVVAQSVTEERSAGRWLVPVLLLALIPGLLWFLSHGPRQVVQTPAPVTGTANRAVPELPKTKTPEPDLPANVDLYFKTGSARLQPESYARLNDFAGALAANPDAHVTVSGYTDNVGNAASNMRLSQERANAVEADLVHRGISANRLTSKGFGEENPIADNDTAEGRGMNRRVSVGIGDH
jgi:OmpA-OmpF porin, OOP family